MQINQASLIKNIYKIRIKANAARNQKNYLRTPYPIKILSLVAFKKINCGFNYGNSQDIFIC